MQSVMFHTLNENCLKTVIFGESETVVYLNFIIFKSRNKLLIVLVCDIDFNYLIIVVFSNFVIKTMRDLLHLII